jgi:leader peptidase (prepilin peptidase) / N-methyltransferase
MGEWYFRRYGQEGLGLGDAKLFAAAGAWLGWQALPMALLIAAVSGLVVALALGKTARATPLPFGPALALGFWVTWLFKAPLPGLT